VLFIPGNAGDYKQVRSIGVQTFEDWEQQQKANASDQAPQVCPCSGVLLAQMFGCSSCG
jgi:hypothetical protein